MLRRGRRARATDGARAPHLDLHLLDLQSDIPDLRAHASQLTVHATQIVGELVARRGRRRRVQELQLDQLLRHGNAANTHATIRQRRGETHTPLLSVSRSAPVFKHALDIFVRLEKCAHHERATNVFSQHVVLVLRRSLRPQSE